MTATNIYAVLRAALAERIPAEVEGAPAFFCAPAIDYAEEAFVVASVSLTSRVPQGNWTADMTVEFTLYTPVAEGWTTEKTEAAFDSLAEILDEVMTPASLNSVAEGGEYGVFFPLCRWDSTAAATSDGVRRSQPATWVGVVQG